MLLWELLNCEIPYRNVDSSAIIWGVGSTSLTLPIPTGCGFPPAFRQLIEHCWSDNPRNRPSFRQILVDLKEAAPELEMLEPNYFYSIQQQWREDIRNRLKAMMMRRRRSSTNALSNEPKGREDHLREEAEKDLIVKRQDELLHAQHIREEYERKRECANNLYMELMTCLLKLEQREKELIQRETEFSVKVGSPISGARMHHSPSIISPFVEKVPQVFQRNLVDGQQLVPYSLLNATLTANGESSDFSRDSSDDTYKRSHRRRHFRPKLSVSRGGKGANCKKVQSCNCSPDCQRRSIKRRSTAGRVPVVSHQPAGGSMCVPNVTLPPNEVIRQTPRPSALLNESDRRRAPPCRRPLVEQSTQTEHPRYSSCNSDSSPLAEATTSNVRHIDKCTSTSSLDLMSSLSSPNYGHGRLVPKMSTTSTFDSGYGDYGYQSCLSTPSTHSMRIRFPDKSPVTPNSVKSATFENEFDLEEFNATANGTCCSNATSKVSFGRMKARQTNSNTLPSLSSIDENGVNEEIEHCFEKKRGSMVSVTLSKDPEEETEEAPQSKPIRADFPPKPCLCQRANDSERDESNSSSFFESDSESVHSSGDDEESTKYLLSDHAHRVRQFNKASQRYCDSMSSSDDGIAAGEDLHKLAVPLASKPAKT